tara:strand:- start:875 stop:2140 length:1266 start_codon:yes stop_codon:yes gene_type:complete
LNKASIKNCAEILDINFLDLKPADSKLSEFFRKNKNIGSQDRGYIAELFYGVIRNKVYLEKLVGSNDSYQMILVYLIKILRKSIREVLYLITDKDEIFLKNIKSIKISESDHPVRLSLPDWIWKKLVDEIGEKKTFDLASNMLSPANLNIRVNSLRKKSFIDILSELRLSFPDISKDISQTAISKIGITLPRGTSIQRHPLFLNGNIEVQDEGSQILSYLVSPDRGQMVADFCAGAGGKSLALSSLMKNTGRIYAFDVSEKRLANLKQRLKRSGASNITMQRINNENDIKIKRLKGKFDRVLVDAPCTGLGTLRRNPDLKWKHNEISLNELICKQDAILNSASNLCKVGGYLVYATCSILKDENENQVENFIKKNINFRVISQSSIMARYKIKVGNSKYLKLNSLDNDTDCFFGVVLERVK